MLMEKFRNAKVINKNRFLMWRNENLGNKMNMPVFFLTTKVNEGCTKDTRSTDSFIIIRSI